MSLEKQEIFCHECGNYVQFDIDVSLNGNHVLKCPSCGHEHCRVVKNGIITEDRWDSRNPTFNVSPNSITYTNLSTFTTFAQSNSSTTVTNFLYNSWINTGQQGTNSSGQMGYNTNIIYQGGTGNA